MKSRFPGFFSPSFALISVLALVSLAALTATAFLASARLDRQATGSLGDTARLEMACASAKECASQTLNIMCEPKWQTIATYWRGTNTNDWTNELGYLLLGRPNSAANVRWTYFGGFNPSPHKKLDTNVFLLEGTNINPGSYLTEIGSFMATMTNGFITNPTSTNTNCTLIPLLGGRTSPPVGWTYIYQDKKIANSTNTTNVPVARFSYYMEDLSGLIDAERMGGTNRATGTNATEISLTNLTTNWSSTSIINAGNYNQFINPTNRSKYFSPALILYANTNISTNDLRYFAHGLLSWSNFPNTIPVGVPINNSVGYSQGGQLKTNLNTSANLNVTSIADVITANLPGFTNRAGGFCLSAGGGAINAAAYAGTAYVQTLAANIKDFIDTDSDPTTDGTALSTNRIRPVYRGVDSYPFVNEINKRYLLSSTNAMIQGGTNGIAYTVLTTDYLELWNLSSQTSPAGTLQFVAIHGQPGTLGFQPISFANPLGASNSLGQVVNGTTTNNFSVPAIPPNGFSILSCPTVTNLFFSPSTNPAVFSLTQEFTNSRYFVAWNNVYYDAALGGIRRNSGNLTLGTAANRANLPSFIYATSSGAFTNPAVGDPRATIYLSQVQDFNAYVGNATFGGRNVRAGSVAASMEYYEVTPNRWPDGGHSSPQGSSPTSDNQIPTSFAPINTNLPPGRILNRGSLSNICELGGVFDPMQWGDPSLGVWQGKWTNLSTSGVSNNTYGGGTTLRIGRSEHSPFAFVKLKATDTYPVPNMGQSAVALLDIFSVSDAYDNGGKINLNTAPSPVLRALAGGVILTNDSAMKPSSTLTVPNPMTEAFAQGVMRFRAVNPFLTPSQLAFIATDYGITNPTTSHWTNTWPTNAVFGNTNPTIFLTNAPGNTLGTNASMGVSAWNDQASEEWFSKIYNLSTVQSWNYRTYVVAQLVNTNGLPTGPSMRKYSLMYIRYNSAFPTISAGPFTSFESPY
jgi:hypothetical protein